MAVCLQEDLSIHFPHFSRFQTKRYVLLFGGLRTLGTVLGTGLHSSVNTLSIECTADDMVTNTGKILNSAATDKNNTVLLKVMTYAGNVSRFKDYRKSLPRQYSTSLRIEKYFLFFTIKGKDVAR